MASFTFTFFFLSFGLWEIKLLEGEENGEVFSEHKHKPKPNTILLFMNQHTLGVSYHIHI